MEKRCPQCGAKLIEIKGDTLCPNCGTDTSQLKSEVEDPGYIG